MIGFIVLLTLVGCGQDRLPASERTTVSDGTSSGSPSSDGATSSAMAEPSASADRLVGMWGTDDPGAGEIVYRFDGDGTYAYVGILLQARPTGTFRFQQQASGAYSVEGDQLHLQPTDGRMIRHDPDDPLGDYERPISLTAESYTWTLDQRGLTLVGTDSSVLNLTSMSN